MSEVVIRTRDNGPFLVTGPVKLIDADGNVFHITKETFSLCRCGESKNRPFCDGSHKGCGFLAGEKAPPPPTPEPQA